MLTNISIRNFKQLQDVSLELGETVVFVGPNNSGKTTALQALALWEVGLKRWLEKRKGPTTPEMRPGVTINRRDLIAIPVPGAKLLWRDLHVRDIRRGEGRTQHTQNIRIDIVVEGITNGQKWICGLEFDYANEESFFCRPLRLSENNPRDRMVVPPEAGEVRIAFLPPMSGLASEEPKWEAGRINVLIGQGQTAQVLRNLCYQIHETDLENWNKLSDQIKTMFAATLLAPEYIPERGEITMSYQEDEITLDLSAAGRGMQQILLLLAYLYTNPGTILLLDEPDAHLEILRQRQIYQVITTVAAQQGCQIIAASHSEVILNEAADRDIVIAFVGHPHRIDDRGGVSQVLKSLKEIGFEHYYQAQQTGWVLYLEGATDLAILRAFASILGHQSAQEVLTQPYVHYVANQPNEVSKHFGGLREAKPDLVGISLFDRLTRPLPPDLESNPNIESHQWHRREIENYLCMPETLLSYARQDSRNDLFSHAEAQRRSEIMERLIQDVIPPIALRDRTHAWWINTKATDDFLDPLFAAYFAELGLPNLLRKTDYHALAQFIPKDMIDPEIGEKLDAIVRVAGRAEPTGD